MKTRSMFVDSSPHVVPDKNGLGVADGESFELVIVLGSYTLRSARFYGDENNQRDALNSATDALERAKVEIQYDDDRG